MSTQPAAAQDHLLVVRVESLKAFEAELSSDSPKEKPVSTTERNSLIAVIAALCNYSDIDVGARGTAKQIAAMTEETGAPITDDTIRKFLRKIPDALEARMK